MSTHFTTLQIERRGGVATVWMNRPDKHNAFNEALIAELDAAFAQLDADAAVRAVVLAGRGKSFSAGADLRWMKAQGEASEAANVADARRLADMLARLSADAGESQGAGGYLSSHPPTPERIDRLHRLSPNDQE